VVGEALVALIERWQAFNLESQRGVLDQNAALIAQFQDQSVEARKSLAESTKAFRRYADDEKLSRFGALLRCYQEEVDRLTRRGKSAENAYLSLYKALATIPDPVPALTSALSGKLQSKRLTQLEMENRRLQQELDNFHAEFHEIKNQEVTVRQLEEQLRQYKSKMNELVEEQVRVAEDRLHAEYAAKLAEAASREEAKITLINTLRQEAASLHESNERIQGQLFELRASHEEESAGKQQELNMLLDEVNRASSNIESLEQQNTDLKQKLAEKNDPTNLASSAHLEEIAELKLIVAQREVEISKLEEKTHTLSGQVVAEQQNASQTQEQLLSELTQERNTIVELRQELESRPSISEVQRLQAQLVMFRSTLGDNTDADPSNPPRLSTVEELLRKSNRQLQTENVTLKATINELSSACEEYKQKWQNEIANAKDQARLVAKLEEDLFNLNSSPPTLARDVAFSQMGVQSPNESSHSLPDGADMLQIVCEQRDRFRQSLKEKEQEVVSLKNSLEIIRRDMDVLRQDNVKLYQKIKYLQSYQNSSSSSPHQSINVSSVSDDTENKYMKLYERSVDPFAQFNRKERASRYKELSAAEKVTLNFGSFFLGTKFSRMFIFFYAIALHVLVFSTLYKLAGSATYA